MIQDGVKEEVDGFDHLINLISHSSYFISEIPVLEPLFIPEIPVLEPLFIPEIPVLAPFSNQRSYRWR
jgi:hypothetical protein